jgi:ribosomal protein S18 acetylase RimI-like enzyme
MEIIKGKDEKATIANSIFMWKHFRDCSIEKFSENIKNTTDYVEIRDNGKIIAVGYVERNKLTYACVHEEYRGIGLQKILIKERAKIIKSKRKYKEVTVDVRCKNIASLKNLIKSGFSITETFRYGNDDLGYFMKKQIKL